MALASPLKPLDAPGLLGAVEDLGRRDPDLAGIIERHGPPPLWDRRPGFETLVAIVLEQQVSLGSAAAALARLRSAAGGIDPARVAALGEPGARAAGLTRQKARFVVGLATATLGGELDLEALATLDDDAARVTLMALVGVGRWTADIYLLMALCRPDIWPDGDLALATALARLKALDRRPTAEEQRGIVETWRPWRAVGARLLWHAYLAGER